MPRRSRKTRSAEESSWLKAVAVSNKRLRTCNFSCTEQSLDRINEHNLVEGHVQPSTISEGEQLINTTTCPLRWTEVEGQNHRKESCGSHVNSISHDAHRTGHIKDNFESFVEAETEALTNENFNGYACPQDNVHNRNDEGTVNPAQVFGLQECADTSEHLEQDTSRNQPYESRWEPQSNAVEPSVSGMAILRKKVKQWDNELELASLFMLTGSVRFSRAQYNVARCLPLVSSEPGRTQAYLTPHDTVRRHFFKIIHELHPSMTTIDLNKQVSLIRQYSTNSAHSPIPAEDEEPNVSSGDVSDDRAPGSTSRTIRVVAPSSWARLDVATHTVYNFLYGDEHQNGMYARTFENARIVRNRNEVVRTHSFIFVERKGAKVPAYAGSIISVHISGSPPNLPHQYIINSTTDQRYVIQGEVVASWCAGRGSAEHDLTSSAVEAMKCKHMNSEEALVVESYCRKISVPQRSGLHGVDFFIRPGDNCTLIRPRPHSRPQTVYAVIINRYWKERDGIPSCTLLWCTVDTSSSTPVRTRVRHIVQSCSMIKAVDTSANRGLQRPPTDAPTQASSRLRGKLQDGTPYVVYRVLLYSDDFQPRSTLYPSGSVGGCYLLPIGLPPEARRTTSSIRVISLTPPGVSTNQVLHCIVEDLLQATVEGVQGFTPDGEKVRIFIDLIGYIGDYLAAAHTVDVFGHMGRAPCTVCSFRKQDVHHENSSRNGYTAAVTARNSAFNRTAERHIAMRQDGLSDRDANRLGLKPSNQMTEQESPLLYLYEKLDGHRDRIPLNNEGQPVVSGLFDPYICNVIAPDHLLSGLAVNAMNALFYSLPEATRVVIDSCTVAALNDNDLLKQKQIFNTRTKKMNSMTLSGVFCVLCVSAVVIEPLIPESYSFEVARRVMRLIKKLQNLVALTYWWPDEHLDGAECVQFVTGTEKEMYYLDMQRLSSEYVNTLDRVCSDYPALKAHLDKPNVHRLLELYKHSVLNFGHAREFMELVFEHAHQPLKRAIARSNFHDEHLSAVDQYVANDWQGRMASLHTEATKSTLQHSRKASVFGIRYLMFGSAVCHMDVDEKTVVSEELDTVIHRQFNQVVLKQIQQNGLISNFAAPYYCTWICHKPQPKVRYNGTLAQGETFEEVISTARSYLAQWYPHFREDSVRPASVMFYSEAKRTRVGVGSGGNNFNIGRHEVIRAGCAVQARIDGDVEPRRVVEPSKKTSARTKLFAVVALAKPAETEGTDPWALVIRCKVVSRGELVTSALISKDSVKWLKLTNQVRRIGLYRSWLPLTSNIGRIGVDQKGGGDGMEIARSFTDLTRDLFDGCTMKFQTRRDGFPPRMG